MLTKILFALSSVLITAGAGAACTNQATVGLIGLSSLMIGFLILGVTVHYDMKS